MSLIRLTTSAEQVAEYLRTELQRGVWRDFMPGVLRLEKETGVNRKAIGIALKQLEKEGLLIPQGAGKRRRITAGETRSLSSLRVAFLLDSADGFHTDYIVKLRHLLGEAGHTTIQASRSLSDLGMKIGRVRQIVARTPADAWVVGAGSREVLEWFSAGETPAFALFGMMRGLPLAGAKPDKVPAYQAATRRLIGLGHRRIVLLARTRRREPAPGASERAFLAELAANGIEPGDYHFPHWEENMDGFLARLQTMFRVTPPTALIVQEVSLYLATLHFLARRGIRVPADVSIICTDGSLDFCWCQPPVSHIRWDSDPVIRQVIRWTNKLSRGKQDRRQAFTPAEFVEGGTIARASDIKK
jgi:DNA-binding LacI/PurR family transcriptional regulator